MEWALCTTSLLTLAYATVLTVFFDVKAAREERWLSAAFPGYAAYQARVGKLIPFAYRRRFTPRPVIAPGQVFR